MNQLQSSTSNLVPSSSALTIIGAGPIGLEAAAWAAARNWDVVLFEKNNIGHHIRQWGHIKLFSPFHMNHSNWGPHLLIRAFPKLILPEESSCISGNEYVSNYLEPLSQLPELSNKIFLETRVIQIGKEDLSKNKYIAEDLRLDHPFRILVAQDNSKFIHQTHAVIDASGVYSSPQFMGSGNIPALGELEAKKEIKTHIHSGIPDILGINRLRFANRKILLVGSGHSAATSLKAFQKLVQETSQTKVLWLSRSRQKNLYDIFVNDPLPDRDALSRLGNSLATKTPNWLEYLPGSTVQQITSLPQNNQSVFKITVKTDSGYREFEIDEIISNVGFMPDNSLYRQLQIHECYATSGPIKLAATLLEESTDCLAHSTQDIETLKNPEPNFFILGNKSYGTNPSFLLSTGIKQIETVMLHLSKTAVANH